MAKILRCPACGALWQLEDKDDAPTLRCGACGAVFGADKAESVRVDDDALAEFLTKKAQKAKQEEAEGAAKMAKLADAMKDFESLPSTDAADERSGEEPPARPAEGALKRLGFGVLFAASAAAAIAAGALLAHEAVLEQFPLLRPTYESVCTKAPCPGFVWAQPQAFEAAAEIVAPTGEADQQSEETAPADAKRPDVRMTLTNRSDYPQRLPIVEMKLLDAAGDTIALRIIEPADYGAGAAAVLPPGERFESLVHVQTELPYAAAGVSVAPVTAP